MLHRPVTTSEPMPPITTARTAPHHCAVSPLSNSPSSFDAPRNSEFTALTRPRISGGVPSCSTDERITTLTISDAPTINRAMIESGKLFDTPKRIVDAPNIATQVNISTPARRRIGHHVSENDTTSAPIA